MRDLVSEREKINHYDIAHVTIKGKTPLLMNQYVPGRQNDAKKQTLKKKVYSPEEDAAKSAYMAEIDGVKQLFIPSLCVYTMIVQACSGKKIPNPQGGRAIAAKGIIAGSLKIAPDKIPLGTEKYEIDIRRARIGQAAIDRARAMLPEWEASFDIVYDSDLIKSPEVFLEILDDAGDRLGLLDYRPQHMGPFGTFTVTKFEVPE
jgi:hypothetical protein